MKWPWRRARHSDHVVAAWCAQTLAYVVAREREDGCYQVVKLGLESQGSDTLAVFATRLEKQGLAGCRVSAMLRYSQYQWLQIEAPSVPAEELRSAARYQIRDMIDMHVDDVTIDVLRVGDGQTRSSSSLFVIAAPNAALRGGSELASAMRWVMPVVDVQETAQRNLQNLVARRDGTLERATACLVIMDDTRALLTISANEELFYSRRLDVPAGFMAGSWETASPEFAVDSYTPVDEYVPEYGVGGQSYGADYSQVAQPHGAGADGATGSADSERAQRFLLEVQRSLDLWDRAWSSMPLESVHVHAGVRSAELAQWLGRQLGQSVSALEVEAFFPGFDSAPAEVQAACWPLLGLLLRTEERKL
jgi:MSHA biogenesis protein MshI